MNIDDFKKKLSGKPKYKLKNANVFVSKEGWHAIDHIDSNIDIDPEINRTNLTNADINYIENFLQFNKNRLHYQIKLITSKTNIYNKKVLDIGCGGGIFLSEVRNLGAKVEGIELNETRAAYAEKMHGITVVKRPVEDKWWNNKLGTYDIITLWDVIEHVNYPHQTLKNALKLLKPGGYIAIDTPCRDSFYHRFGVFTYNITLGKYPTFLNSMYSSRIFGHKQIFSTIEIKNILTDLSTKVLMCKKIHELSFPIEFYLKSLTGSKKLSRQLAPVITNILKIIRIKNKVFLIAQKSL